MTSEEKREYSRKQNKKNQLRKKQIKKRKQIMRLFIYVGIQSVFCIYSFLLGKMLGVKATLESNAVSIDVMDSGEDISEENKEKKADGKVGNEIEDLNTEIILVNRDHPLPEDYEVELLRLPDGVNRAAKEAYEPLCDMLTAGRREGLNFEICSSYRDVEYQTRLFDEDVEALIQRGYSYREAYDEVAKETMPPGCSEHSTGLAFDIVAMDYQMLDDGQERTAENRWLQEHCAEYGFILRYPEGKEDITSINYESWHFRYVGREAAEYIMEKEITLEEYLGCT